MLSWMPTAGSGQERSFPQISQPAILTYTALSKMAVYRWRLVTNPGVGNLGFDIVERHRDKSCLRLRLGLSVIGFMLAFAFSQMLAISSGNLEKPPQFWHDVDEPILT